MDVSPRLIRAALLSVFLALGAGSPAAQETPQGAAPENRAVSEPAATDAEAAEDMDGEDAAPAEEGAAKGADARDDRRAEASDEEVAELRGRIEAALGRGDEEAIGEVFTRRSVVLPLMGDALEGLRDIRRHLGAAPRPESFRMRSQRIDRIGRLVIDTGGITITETGGRIIEAGYVLVARMAKDGLRILHLTMFPAREAVAQ